MNKKFMDDLQKVRDLLDNAKVPSENRRFEFFTPEGHFVIETDEKGRLKR